MKGEAFPDRFGCSAGELWGIGDDIGMCVGDACLIGGVALKLLGENKGLWL